MLAIIRSAKNAVGAFSAGGGAPTFIGCGAIRPSDFGAGRTTFNRAFGTPILQSFYSFGFNAASSALGWNATSSKNNATEQTATAETAYQHNATTPFTSADDSSPDFRPIAGTSLDANGFRDSINAPRGISGAIRPASPTIGPWEIVPVSGTTQNFTLSGDGGLSGTVTIDTGTGLVASLTATYAGDSFTFSVLHPLGQTVVDIQGWDAMKTKYLHLALQLSSLIGYMGGNLCGTNNPCDGSSVVSEVYASCARLPDSRAALARWCS